MSSELSSVTRVTGSLGMGSLVDVADGLLGITLSEGQALLRLSPELLLRKLGGVMPGVVISRAVDLGEFLFRWLDLVSSVLCGIAGNVS
jgi:hypothetical protein